MEVAPDNAWALNSLGAMLFHTGRVEEAIPLFRAAIVANPELAAPYASLAFMFLNQGRVEEALATLRGLFSKAKMQDVRCRSIFDQARKIFESGQEKLSETMHPAALQAVETLRESVERVSGHQVRVNFEALDGIQARLQIAWHYGRDHHLVVLDRACPEKSQPYLLASEYRSILLLSEAYKAGKNLVFTTGPNHRRTLLEDFGPNILRMVALGHEEEWVMSRAIILRDLILGCLFNLPMEMVVQRCLHKETPVMAPSQFLLQLFPFRRIIA